MSLLPGLVPDFNGGSVSVVNHHIACRVPGERGEENPSHKDSEEPPPLTKPSKDSRAFSKCLTMKVHKHTQKLRISIKSPHMPTQIQLLKF